MIDLANAILHVQPYPWLSCDHVFDPEAYERLETAFPTERGFAYAGGGYHKFFLSERGSAALYESFIRQSPAWKPFYDYVKRGSFVQDVLGMLAKNHIVFDDRITARFEFSSLPADGGYLLPHTDIPSKIVTLVIPLTKDWDPSWGGGTDLLVPSDPTCEYRDYKTPREAFKTIATFPCAPNTCLIFVRSNESWHAVGPLKGPANRRRRTLTINLERAR